MKTLTEPLSSCPYGAALGTGVDHAWQLDPRMPTYLPVPVSMEDVMEQQGVDDRGKTLWRCPCGNVKLTIDDDEEED